MSLDMEERPRTPIDSRTDAALRAARGLGKLQALLEQECEAQVGPGCAAAVMHCHERLEEGRKYSLDLCMVLTMASGVSLLPAWSSHGRDSARTER